MQLARVIGNVVSTVKNATLTGRKLMVIQILNGNLAPAGKPLVAVDSVGAGVGELVFWCRGKEASFPFEGSDVPTDCTIVGIVDSAAHVTLTTTRQRISDRGLQTKETE
jgi:ethanolamine utilization protein EutN